jgi:hypothetical protein
MPSGNTMDQYSTRNDGRIPCTIWRQIRSVTSSGTHQVAIVQSSMVAASIGWAISAVSGLVLAIDRRRALARVVIAAAPMLIQ